MNSTLKLVILFVLTNSFGFSCKNKIKQQEDEIYSRQLQEHIKLTVISTPLPEDKTTLNLLLLNDGQDALQFRVQEILDSLYNKKFFTHLFIVVSFKIKKRRIN